MFFMHITLADEKKRTYTKCFFSKFFDISHPWTSLIILSPSTKIFFRLLEQFGVRSGVSGCCLLLSGCCRYSCFFSCWVVFILVVHVFLISNIFCSTQPQCCLNFPCIELQILHMCCCLMHTTIIIQRHFL